MKKSLILLPLILTFAFQLTVSAQSKIPVKLGLKASPNIGWMTPGTKGYSSDGALVGGTIGFISDIYFAPNYALSTGLNFQYINGSLEYRDSLLVTESNHYVTKYGDISARYKILYLEIPITVKMSTKQFGKMSYFGQIGFGTGFRLNANKNEEFQPVNGEPVDQQYEFNGGTTLIREAVLIGLGFTYHLDESSRILVGINYSNSLNNILTGTNYSTNEAEKSHLNFAELNIGFIF